MAYISDFLSGACYYDFYLKNGCTSKHCNYKHYNPQIREVCVKTFVKFMIPNLKIHSDGIRKTLKLNKKVEIRYGICIHKLVNDCKKNTIKVNIMYKGEHQTVDVCYTFKNNIMYCSFHMDFLYEKVDSTIKFKGLIPFGKRVFKEEEEIKSLDLFPPILTDKCEDNIQKPVPKPIVKWVLRKTSFVPEVQDLIDMKNLILTNKIKSIKEQLEHELKSNISLGKEIKELKQKIKDHLLEKHMVYLKPRYTVEQKCSSCGLGVKEVLCKYCVEDPYSDDFLDVGEEEIYYSDIE